MSQFRKTYNRPSQQKGVVVVFATLAMAVLIGAGAMALDVGNLILTKGKLQNLADSAALSAAKTIDLGGDQTEATTAGKQAITNNLAFVGYNSISLDDSNIYIEFSETLPFDPGTVTADSTYVRVRIENVDIPDFLVSILDVDLNSRASAVAGPSTSLGRSCNIVPLSICQGDTPSATNIAGYNQGTLHVLKASSSTPSELGPGNFMAVTLTDADGNPQTGASHYKDALAGEYESCLNVEEDEPILTETGNMVGPTLAMDTRFDGVTVAGYKDSDYVGDVNSQYQQPDYVAVTEVTTDVNGVETTTYQPNKSASEVYTYAEYMADYENKDYQACLDSASCQSGGYYRRVITVPILKCDTATKKGGRMEVDLAGLGCFFLTQPVSMTTTDDDNSGNGNGSWIIGEFVEDCRNNSGNPGNVPGGSGPYKIVLFDDPDSEDS